MVFGWAILEVVVFGARVRREKVCWMVLDGVVVDCDKVVPDAEVVVAEEDVFFVVVWDIELKYG